MAKKVKVKKTGIDMEAIAATMLTDELEVAEHMLKHAPPGMPEVVLDALKEKILKLKKGKPAPVAVLVRAEEHPLIGQTIFKIRPMTKKEGEKEGWEFGRHGAPMILELSNGALVYPSCDPEGNRPGALFGAGPDGTSIYVQE